MPKSVIQNLEAVQVQEQYGKQMGRPPRALLTSVGHPVEKQGAIWQARQSIVKGVVAKPFLGLDSLDDLPFQVFAVPPKLKGALLDSLFEIFQF